MSRYIRWIGVCCVLLIVLIGLSPAHAKFLAYVIDTDGNVLTLDTDTDTIISRRTVPQLASPEDQGIAIYESARDNLLLVSRGRERSQNFRVAAYDLTSLAFKKDLGIVSTDPPLVLLPPKGPHFFVGWLDSQANQGQGGPRLTRFDKATLTRMGDLPYPNTGNLSFFSPDGTRLYAVFQEPTQRVVVLDTQTFQPQASFELSSYLAPNRWGGDVNDIQADRMVLVENIKARAADPNRYTLFTVRLTDGAQSPRIVTGLQGVARLTPQGEKILFFETTRNYISVGRLHVYDVATGAKLGQVTFPAHRYATFRATRPQGDKIYLDGDAARKQEMTLMSLSLVTFTFLRETAVPQGALLFFETP